MPWCLGEEERQRVAHDTVWEGGKREDSICSFGVSWERNQGFQPVLMKCHEIVSCPTLSGASCLKSEGDMSR